jgi:hypothetical protein
MSTLPPTLTVCLMRIAQLQMQALGDAISIVITRLDGIAPHQDIANAIFNPHISGSPCLLTNLQTQTRCPDDGDVFAEGGHQ